MPFHSCALSPVELANIGEVGERGTFFLLLGDLAARLEGFLLYENGRERRMYFESETIIRAIGLGPTQELAKRGYREGYRRWLGSNRDRERRAAAP